jgi:hypothetical protein
MIHDPKHSLFQNILKLPNYSPNLVLLGVWGYFSGPLRWKISILRLMANTEKGPITKEVIARVARYQKGTGENEGDL